MEYSYWSIVLVVFKFVSYLSVAALAGGLTIQTLLTFKSNKSTTELVNYLTAIRRWQIIWAAVGLVFALLHLPVGAATLSDTGWQGLIDGLMINIVWQSAIGTQSWIRATGYVLALIAFLLNRQSISEFSFSWGLISVVAVLMITFSFVLTGHTVNSGWIIQFILGVHVTAMALWIGSLWPLYKSNHFLNPSDVKDLMFEFGRVAVGMVLVLLVCGVILLFQFIDSFEHLFTTGYGQLILFKLTLVTGMLLLAAWHKLVLVPKLLQEKNNHKLKRSIGIEALVGTGVLIVTSVVTTIVGPA